MLRRFFFLCCLLTAVTGDAQNQKQYTRRIFLASTSKYKPRPWNLRDSLIRDTSVCRIYYQHRFVMDTMQHKEVATMMVCDIGIRNLSYFSLAMRLSHLIFTKVEIEAEKKGRYPGMSVHYSLSESERALKEFAGDSGTINSEIWLDRSQGILTERAADYASENIAYEYEELQPILNWNISGEHRQVCGYDCIKATGLFRGRQWTVWFTPEIPLPYGPWKLGGLPGLILRAEDYRKHFVWECCGIKQEALPMAYYIISTRQLTRNKFNAWMARFHHSPYDVIDGGRGTTLIQTYSAQGLKEIDKNWMLPYNPIELE